MIAKPRPSHSAAEFDLDIFTGDDDIFRWFLLCYLFGKPIQSQVAVQTWQLFIDRQLDTPWAILGENDRRIVRLLHEGGYARYAEVTTRGLRLCMEQLIRDYDGSIALLVASSEDESECIKRLTKLHGVGPKVAEIFMVEAAELFARRVE